MLTLIFALLAGISSMCICTASRYPGLIWVGMFMLIGIATFAALLVLYVLFLVICSLPVDLEKPQTEISPFYRFLMTQSTGLLVHLCGVRVKTEGFEHIPKDRPFLLVGNHRSNFDPIIALWTLRHYKLTFVSKPENLQMPIVGKILYKCGFLAIDREDDRRAVTTILAAAAQIQNGTCSVGIYPEGTRNREGTGLLPFKNGSFKIAQRTGAPIVVAAIEGTERIHRHAPLPTHVRFSIAGVIEQPEGRRCGTQELSQQAQQMLCHTLGIENPGKA